MVSKILNIVILIILFVCHTNKLYPQKQIWTWGSNNRAQLGDGVSVESNTPIQITGNIDWIKVVSGNSFSIALKADGTLWGWGWNDYGNFGDGTNSGINIPTQIGTDTDWSDVVVGDLHILALKSNGTIWSSGVNTYGQLADGTFIDKNTLTQIGSDNDWIFISAGANDIHVIKSDGTLWGAGINGNGSLGVGDNTNRNTLTQLGTDNDWEFVTSGSEHTLAIKTDGTLWGCGFNSSGPLGDGTANSRNSLTQVGADNDWAYVDAGHFFSFAIKTDGTLWSTGSNSHGQLGDGSNSNQITFTQVGTDTIWTTVSCGVNHTIAVKSDGTMWGTGYNVNGELGDGTNADNNTFQRVGNSYHWVSASAGGNHSAALYILNIKPIVTTKPIALVTSESAMSGGIIIDDGGLTITAKGIVWSELPNPTIALQTKTNVLTSNYNFNSLMTGLFNNTIYYVRAYATNSLGINYGEQIIFTALDSDSDGDGIMDIDESLGPNNGDGNSDGIPDSQQPNVASIYIARSQSYITIYSPDCDVNDAGTYDFPTPQNEIYPYGLIQFKLPCSNAIAQIFFHNTADMSAYSYNKLNPSNIIEKFPTAEFSQALIGGNEVAVVTLQLTDGGAGDYDGIVNGIIYDPGGPAIAAGGQIPTLSEWARIFAFCIFIGVSIWWWRRI